MALQIATYLVLFMGCVCANPVNEAVKVAAHHKSVEDKEDLRTVASNTVTRTGRYADWGNYPSSGYTSGYGVTGYGNVGDGYSSYYGSGYDNNYGYNSGYGGSGYNSGYGGSGYNSGYGGSGYSGYGRGGGYGLTGYGSSGGYGGWGGNGGLNSYYGYNNPNYQGSYNLGYGYYNNKRPGPGYGNIYNNGITPSLVTGYRGYSRR